MLAFRKYGQKYQDRTLYLIGAFAFISALSGILITMTLLGSEAEKIKQFGFVFDIALQGLAAMILLLYVRKILSAYME